MALIVAFTAARIMEFTGMLIVGIDIDEWKKRVKIKPKKTTKDIEYNIEVNMQKIKNMSKKAIINWLKDDECMKGKQDSVRYEQIKKKKMSSQTCIKSFWKVIDKVGIDQQYGSATVHHATMTKQRKYGATQDEVNTFIRHVPATNMVNLYFKSDGRDMSTLLLSGGDFRGLNGINDTISRMYEFVIENQLL
ncbi:MAG: hypothetical protein EZS28_018051 [Streblomastix strix]|uniref:Tyr recombinase domain-containing protein n=1 Tax=Streblomastix strix TaxID=222440 RepID=A0A5J4VVM5_9EUKA|nr:MAG: hypothetical protein EZS28_018051 [Streblomastix strix]